MHRLITLRLPLIASSALVGITAEVLNVPHIGCVLLVIGCQAALLGLAHLR